jgi:hypothetical protein
VLWDRLDDVRQGELRARQWQIRRAQMTTRIEDTVGERLLNHTQKPKPIELKGQKVTKKEM